MRQIDDEKTGMVCETMKLTKWKRTRKKRKKKRKKTTKKTVMRYDVMVEGAGPRQKEKEKDEGMKEEMREANHD